MVIMELLNFVMVQVFAIEFVAFAIEFVPFTIEFVGIAIEFVLFAIDFVGFAIDFVGFAIEFIGFCNRIRRVCITICHKQNGSKKPTRSLRDYCEDIKKIRLECTNKQLNN